MIPLLLPLNHGDPSLASSFSDAVQHTANGSKVPNTTLSARPKSSRHDSLDNSAAINAIPLPPPEPTLLAELTPCHEQYPDLASVQFQQSLDLPSSPTTGAPLIPKSMRALRLPPFDALGITSEVSSIDPGANQANIGVEAKSADHPPIRQVSLSCSSELPPSPLSDAALQHHVPEPVPSGFRVVNSFVLTHTPPADTGSFDWGLTDPKSTAPSSEQQNSRSETSSILSSGVTSESARGASPGMSGQPSSPYSSAKAPWLGDALGSIRRCTTCP